jgi:hypothetical protein
MVSQLVCSLVPLLAKQSGTHNHIFMHFLRSTFTEILKCPTVSCTAFQREGSVDVGVTFQIKEAWLRLCVTVFHSLLKAHAIEARSVVRQALEILTPAMPVRMEDGNTMLTHWTKKIIVEEGHSVQQLFHILQLVVRHYKVCTALGCIFHKNHSLLRVFPTIFCCIPSGGSFVLCWLMEQMSPLSTVFQLNFPFHFLASSFLSFSYLPVPVPRCSGLSSMPLAFKF